MITGYEKLAPGKPVVDDKFSPSYEPILYLARKLSSQSSSDLNERARNDMCMSRECRKNQKLLYP